MVKKTLFKGAATALITPTNENGVDYKKLEELINWQIAEGIDALVICGTTGEAATLTPSEYEAVVGRSAEIIGKRVPMIAGAGSNCTEKAIELTRLAVSCGADGILSVTPYYNKTTQKGLVKTYEAIADASDKPVILYNVPSRTGVNIEPKTYAELAKHPNICAIKEASGNLSALMSTLSLVGDSLDVYSGNDDQIYPLLALGGKGVISVLSNVLPAYTSKMCHEYFEGNMSKSLKMQLDALPLINALFSEVNPIPVKAAMAAMGKCDNYLRLPLCTMSEDKADSMYKIMREMNIIA